MALDDRATKFDVESQLSWLTANAVNGSRAYFFFSGHGAPDASKGTPYILPYDANPQQIQSSGIPLERVVQMLTSSKAKEVLVFVDSCFSGAGGRSVLPAGARPLVRVREASPSAQVAVLAAARGAEISGPAPGENAGLFSKHLTAALRTGAADADGDGQISLRELADYVTPRVTRDARKDGREQTPSLTVGPALGVPRLLPVGWGYPVR